MPDSPEYTYEYVSTSDEDEPEPPSISLCLHVLACRLCAYTTQYNLQLQTIKRLIMAPTAADNVTNYHRAILRGNRLAAHLRQADTFDRLGVLGAGGFGMVELVRSKENHKFYALKTVIPKKTSSRASFNLLALIERDCAIVLESRCFVKLKAAWVETNQALGDRFKFLWENMVYGDMDNLIKQLHPMTTLDEKFTSPCRDRRYFSFHHGTFREMLHGMDFEAKFRTVVLPLQCLVAENKIITEGGKKDEYVQIIYLYLNQLMEGIRYMHDHGITHRDLKPGNILLAEDLTARIADLGLATNFNAQQIPYMHAWADMAWVSKDKDEYKYAFGGAQGQADFYARRLAWGGELIAAGTRLWMGPEFNADFYDMEEYSQLIFNPACYRRGDFFSLGVILFQLLTGLQPIHHGYSCFKSMTFRDLPNASRYRQQFLMKVKPNLYNPLVHRWITMEPSDFAELFLDMRLHSVAVGLMCPDPRRRLDETRLLQDANYLSLAGEPFAQTQSCFHWNRFLRRRREVPFHKLLRKCRERGSPGEPSFREGRAVPHLPGFPFITASPGLIGTPLKRGPRTPPSPSDPSSPDSSSEGPMPPVAKAPRLMPPGARRVPLARRSQ